MMKRIYFIGILFSIVLIFTGQLESKAVSLLVGEINDDVDGEQIQYLVRYTFDEGVFTGKDTIFSASASGDDFRFGFEFDENMIYNNRYVITGYGNIIDIDNKEPVEPLEFFTSHCDDLIDQY